jgi:hypothetical protein
MFANSRSFYLAFSTFSDFSTFWAFEQSFGQALHLQSAPHLPHFGQVDFSAFGHLSHFPQDFSHLLQSLPHGAFWSATPHELQLFSAQPVVTVMATNPTSTIATSPVHPHFFIGFPFGTK